MADPLDLQIQQAEAEFQASVQANRRDRTLTDRWREAVAPSTEGLAEGIGRFFQTMSQTGETRGMAGFKEPAGPVTKAFGQGIAQTVIPQTPTQAALAGLQFVPGMQGLPFMGRVALPAIAGAAASGLTGESRLSGAAQGLATAGVGEGIRGVAKLASVAMRMGMGGAERRVAEAFMPKFGEAVTKDIPAFGAVAPKTGEAALLLQDPAVGLKTLRKGMDAVDDGIRAVFGREPITVPTLAGAGAEEAIAAKLGLGGQPLPPGVAFQIQQQVPKTLPVDQALSELRILKAEARKAPTGNLGYAQRALARRAEGEFVASVAAKDPNLAVQYRQMVGDFDKGLDWIKAMETMGVSRDVKGAMLRPEALRTFLVENMAEYPRSRFPNIWDAAFPTALGAGDVVTKLTGERLYTPLPGSPRLSVPLGRATLTERVGTPRPPSRNILPRLGGLGAAAAGAEVVNE